VSSRPSTAEEAACGNERAWARRRLKPGTDLWQVSARSRPTAAEMIELDPEYGRGSCRFELRILVRTPPAARRAETP
jgi:lipopolysaccharide/colanic/teichoic acid biosynthesis glycosyltransferase